MTCNERGIDMKRIGLAIILLLYLMLPTQPVTAVALSNETALIVQVDNFLREAQPHGVRERFVLKMRREMCGGVKSIRAAIQLWRRDCLAATPNRLVGKNSATRRGGNWLSVQSIK